MVNNDYIIEGGVKRREHSKETGCVIVQAAVYENARDARATFGMSVEFRGHSHPADAFIVTSSIHESVLTRTSRDGLCLYG